MTNSEKSQINAYLEDYLQTLGINTSKNIMRCPICGDKDGFRFLPNSNKQYWKCFSGKHSSYPRDNGNIFELVSQLNNVDFKKSIEILGNKYLNGYYQSPPKPKLLKKEVDNVEEVQVIKQDIIDAQQNDNRFAYLLTRGIEQSVQERFGIGYLPAWCTVGTRIENNFDYSRIPDYKKSARCIIPTSDSSYIARDIRPDALVPQEAKSYTKIKMGKVHIFNIETLKDGIPVFVTEGEIDALS